MCQQIQYNNSTRLADLSHSARGRDSDVIVSSSTIADITSSWSKWSVLGVWLSIVGVLITHHLGATDQNKPNLSFCVTSAGVPKGSISPMHEILRSKGYSKSLLAFPVNQQGRPPTWCFTPNPHHSTHSCIARLNALIPFQTGVQSNAPQDVQQMH